MSVHRRPLDPTPKAWRLAEPPYLVTTGTDHRALSIGVAADASGAVVEMTLHGRWSQQLGSQVTATLQLCLAGPTTSIIVDLHDMGDLHGTSYSFWLAAARTARLGPAPFQLALCLPPGTILDYRLRHSDEHQPLLFVAMPEAQRVIAGRKPRTRRVQARLAPQPASVPAARELVAGACDAWQLSQLWHDATLIMSEIVTNAVQHARTDLVVTVSSGGPRLHLAVRDGDTRYPRLNEPADAGWASPVDASERGLRLVHEVATAWGAMPTRGGKVVWATVSP